MNNNIAVLVNRGHLTDHRRLIRLGVGAIAGAALGRLLFGRRANPKGLTGLTVAGAALYLLIKKFAPGVLPRAE